MPIREYQCSSCLHVFEELVHGHNEDDYKHVKCRCGELADYLPSVSAPPRGHFGTVSRNAGKQSYKRYNGEDKK